ncbi:hypothetical protein AA313_de0208814 [Arthrobotrys entomopaga]|nr:hypothetical protein AA313_de0208814 [Arthrobotrys entomopaga]
MPSMANCFTLAIIWLAHIVTLSTAHNGEHENCLTPHLRTARALFGDLSNLQFDPEITKRDNVYAWETNSDSGITSRGYNLVTNGGYSLPIIFYSNSPSNQLPIITMAGDGLTAVPAMAIQNDTIIGIGNLPDVIRKAGSRRFFVNLGSKVILPGFIEPHVHILLSALIQGYLVNISPLRAPSFQSAMSLLKAELPNLNTTAGQWLAGYGYDPSRLDWHDLTSKDLDDHISSTVPVIVINASGHLAYANTKAFAVANVTKDTPNPEGGEYAKDASGNLTGVLVELGAISHFSAIASAANEARKPLIQTGLEKQFSTWLSKGITTTFDAGIGTVGGASDLQVMANISLVSPIRIFAAIADYKPSDAETMLGNGTMPPDGFQFKNINVKTVKLWTDGSTQGFTAAVEEPYLPIHFPEYFGNRTRGVLVWPSDNSSVYQPSAYNTSLYSEMLKWMQRGYQIMLHANGDQASQIVLDNFDKIYTAYPSLKAKGLMHRIEHFTVAQPDQVLRVKGLDVGVSHTMGHVHYWGDAFRSDILGVERAERIDPVADDVRDGVCYSFNSDSPVTDADPLLWVSTAITRKVYGSGNVLGEKQRVGLLDALKGVTVNPARQIMRDKELGTLEGGKKADFVVLSEDVRMFEWDRRDVGDLKVLETWVGGRKVWAYRRPG